MKNHLQKLTFLIAGLVLATAVSYINAANWVGPTSNQAIDTSTNTPKGNVDAPINVSASSQSKLGALGVGGLSVLGVGQVSTSSYSLPLSLTFGVNGKIGATQYCDESGNNCSSSVGGSGSSVPAGAVMAFNLSACPSGWIPADGTSGTVDLRGYFVRGLNTSTTGIDPNRTLGSTQEDEFKSHVHSAYIGNGTDFKGNPDSQWNYSVYMSSITTNTEPTGGTETRPKNITLLYCQKI